MRILALMLAVSACSSGDPTKPCMGDVRGQLMGSFSVCNAYDDIYRQNLDAFSFTAEYNELPTVFTMSTTWTIPGEPMQAQYNDQDRTVACSIIMKKGAKTWLAKRGMGTAAAGTCQLTLSSVNKTEETGNTISYHLTGSMAGHLEASPGTGSTGTVDVSMDFDG
jgi:hypothetical protein